MVLLVKMKMGAAMSLTKKIEVIEMLDDVELSPLRECIMCQLPVPAEADENTPYCSDACLHKHVDEAIAAHNNSEKIQNRIVHHASCNCFYE